MECQTIASQIGRPVNRLALPPGAFFALAVGLALVETPVNKFLFDVALQNSNLASYLVSFVVAVFLLISAHIAGKLVRQVWGEFEKKLYVANIVIACVIMVVLAFALTILTVGRAEFSAVSVTTGLDGLFSSVGEKVTAGGLFGVVVNALGDTAALVLVTVNVTSILVAFLLGYFAHDPDRNFDKAFERYRGAQRAVERQDRTYKAKSDCARKQARLELEDINGKYTAANAAIVTQKTARRLPLDDADKFALPDLDRLLERVRTQSDFGGSVVADDEHQSIRGPADVDSLVRAGANVTRVGARDPK